MIAPTPIHTIPITFTTQNTETWLSQINPLKNSIPSRTLSVFQGFKPIHFVSGNDDMTSFIPYVLATTSDIIRIMIFRICSTSLCSTIINLRSPRLPPLLMLSWWKQSGKKCFWIKQGICDASLRMPCSILTRHCLTDNTTDVG